MSKEKCPFATPPCNSYKIVGFTTIVAKFNKTCYLYNIP
jgi:hypothetical protein